MFLHYFFIGTILRGSRKKTFKTAVIVCFFCVCGLFFFCSSINPCMNPVGLRDTVPEIAFPDIF